MPARFGFDPGHGSRAWRRKCRLAAMRGSATWFCGGFTSSHDEDWQAQLQVDQVISRLGLDGDASMSELSGGWRRRVMLGRALVAAPDVLLLDEPTNHLDIDAITWLEDMMLEFAGALFFISHDRVLRAPTGDAKSSNSIAVAYVFGRAATTTMFCRSGRRSKSKPSMPPCSTRSWRRRRHGSVRAWKRGARATKAGCALSKQLRIQRRERRERIGQRGAARRRTRRRPANWCSRRSTSITRFGAAPIIADFSVRIMRQGSHRHHWTQRLRQDHPDQAAGGRFGTDLGDHQARHEPVAGILRSATRAARHRRHPSSTTSLAAAATPSIIDGQPRHVSGYLRDFSISAGTAERAGEHAVGRRTQSPAAGAAVRAAEQSSDHG